MKEQILEEFLKKQKIENPFAEEMVDSVELILNTLNPNLETTSVMNQEIIEEKTTTIYLKNKEDSNDQMKGFIELKNNRIELQYFGDNEFDLGVVIVENDKDGIRLNSFMNCMKNGQEVSLNIYHNKIMVNDKSIAIPENSSTIQIADLLASIVQEYKLFKASDKEETKKR